MQQTVNRNLIIIDYISSVQYNIYIELESCFQFDV